MAFSMEELKKFPEGWVCSNQNQRLAANEFLVKCPYDGNHKVLNKKYCDHLRKCRTNYKVQKDNEGGTPSMASCKYNLEHRVYQPELQYHEHICSDKTKRDDVVLQTKPDAKEKESMPKRKFKKVEEIPLRLISQTLDPDYMGPAYRHVQEPDQFEDMEIFSQTEDPYSFGYVHRQGRLVSRREYLSMRSVPAQASNPVNDDDWSMDSSPVTRKFDWLEKQHNLRGTLRIFPPGLTKFQRKQFEKDNTVRLMCEEGIFHEEEHH